MVSYSTLFCYQEILHIEVLQPPNKFGFGLIPVRSSLTKGITYVFFSSGYLDISVPQLTFLPAEAGGSLAFLLGGLPHSDTAGSKLRDSSPTTFAVLCVLLRPNKPRHPLSALIHAIFIFAIMTKLYF